MALISEAAVQGDFGNTCAASKHFLCARNSNVGKPPVRRKSHGRLEGPPEMASGQATLRGQPLHRNLLGQVAEEQTHGTVDLPGREACATVRSLLAITSHRQDPWLVCPQGGLITDQGSANVIFPRFRSIIAPPVLA